MANPRLFSFPLCHPPLVSAGPVGAPQCCWAVGGGWTKDKRLSISVVKSDSRTGFGSAAGLGHLIIKSEIGSLRLVSVTLTSVPSSVAGMYSRTSLTPLPAYLPELETPSVV